MRTIWILIGTLCGAAMAGCPGPTADDARPRVRPRQADPLAIAGPPPTVDASKAGIHCLEPKCFAAQGFPAWSADRKRVALLVEYGYVWSIAGGAYGRTGLRVEIFGVADGKLLKVHPLSGEPDRRDAVINVKSDCIGADGQGDPHLCEDDADKVAEMTKVLDKRFRGRASQVNTALKGFVGGVLEPVPEPPKKGTKPKKTAKPPAVPLVVRSSYDTDAGKATVVVSHGKEKTVWLQRRVGFGKDRKDVGNVSAEAWWHRTSGTFMVRLLSWSPERMILRFFSARVPPTGPPPHPLLAQLGQGTAAQRLKTLKKVIGLAGPRASRALAALLTDTDPKIRLAAARALGQRPAADAVKPLTGALSDKAPAVRRAAASALLRLKSKLAEPALRKALQNRDGPVRATALEGLTELRVKDLGPLAARLMRDKHAGVRAVALRVLGALRRSKHRSAVVASLRDPDPRVRAKAMSAYVKLHPYNAALGADVFERLLSGLSAKHKAVRSAAVSALYALRWTHKQAKPLAPALAALHSDPDPAVRRTALRTLAKLSSAERSYVNTVPLISRYLNDPKAQVREQAVALMQHHHNLTVIQALARAAQDRSAGVRQMAVRALGRVGAPAVIPPLIRALGDKSSRVAGDAAAGLGQFADPRARKAVLAALARKSTSLKFGAVTGLGVPGNDWAVGVLAKLFGPKHAPFHELICRALLAIGTPAAVRALARAAKSPLLSLSKPACERLAELKGARFVAARAVCLNHKKSGVRADAARSLGSSKAALPYLLRAASHPSIDVRSWAVTNLGFTGSGRAVPVLKKRLSDSSDYIKMQAATSLGRIDTRASTNVLMGALSSSVRSVRYTAFKALAKRRSRAGANKVVSLLRGGHKDWLPQCLQILGRGGGAKAVKTLIRWMKNPKAKLSLRRTAARALGHTKSRLAIKALTDALDDSALSKLRVAVLIGLARLRQPFVPQIVRALPKASYYDTFRLMEAMKRYGNERVAMALAAVAVKGSYSFSERATVALLAMPYKKKGEVLARAVKKAGSLGVKLLVQALYQVKRPPARAFFKLYADDKNPLLVRGVGLAVAICGKGPDRRLALKAFAKGLNDPSDKLKLQALDAAIDCKLKSSWKLMADQLGEFDDTRRMYAAFGLGALGEKRAYKALVQALSDQHLFVRKNAVRSLGQLGLRKAIGPILRHLSTAPQWVWKEAAKVLRKLGWPRRLK